MNPVKRKPPGGPRPRNTLNHRSPGVNALAIQTSRGQNVSTEPIKRQKTSHEIMDDVIDDMPDDAFFSRGLQGRTPTNLGRQSSVSAISINSQENLSQRSGPFGYNEARNVHATLKSSQKKGRKPKSGATQHSSPPRYGAITDPVPVDDDDDVQLLDEQHVAPRSAHHTAVQTPRSPTLAETFIRDDGAPDPVPETRPAQSKLINKMQSISNTSRALQPPHSVDDFSEDELARGQSPARTTKKTARIRSPSPNRITSTHFTTKRKKREDRDNISVHVTSLRMMAGSWEDLYLIYSWADKVMQFNKNGEMLHSEGTKVQLSSKHASKVFCDLKSSTEVVLQGSKGGVSSGRILFDFHTEDDRDAFLTAVDDMNPSVSPLDLEL
jgi:hypothetical protein